jgi:nucleolar complex protein 2
LDQVCDLLIEYLHQHALSIAFPELASPIIVHLRHYAKNCKVSGYRARVKQLIDKVCAGAMTHNNRWLSCADICLLFG